MLGIASITKNKSKFKLNRKRKLAPLCSRCKIQGLRHITPKSAEAKKLPSIFWFRLEKNNLEYMGFTSLKKGANLLSLFSFFKRID